MSGAKQVWIVLEQKDGKLHRMAREAIAAGQRLASAMGGRASAVLLGDGLGEASAAAAAYDLEAVLVADSPALASYTPGAYIGALGPALAAAAPAWVVFPHTYQTVDYAPRLAQEVGAALVPEVIAFEAGGEGPVYTRPVMGGKLHARVRTKGEGSVFLSVQSGAFPADGAAAGSAEVRPLGTDLSGLAADRELVGVEQVGGDQVDLSKAEVVVAVGRGVGGPEKMESVNALAEVLGADIGASRPVIDSGWLPRDRQIGSSGQTVAPKLYFAIGISGAIQHLVGMKGAGCVVSINKDPSAPIFAVSHYGLVGDLHEIVPAVAEAIAEAKG